MRLEQQTVIASWELLQNWLEDRSLSKQSLEQQVTREGAVDINTSLQGKPAGQTKVTFSLPVPAAATTAAAGTMVKFEDVRKDSSKRVTDNLGFATCTEEPEDTLLPPIMSRSISSGSGGDGGVGVVVPYPGAAVRDTSGDTVLGASYNSSMRGGDLGFSAGSDTIKLYVGTYGPVSTSMMVMMMLSYSVYETITDKFLIGTIKINVSFITTPHVVSSSRRKAGQRALLRDSSNGQSSLISTLSLFLWQVRPMLP